jgi:tetratricopeptide (TPR) repeat protein
MSREDSSYLTAAEAKLNEAVAKLNEELAVCTSKKKLGGSGIEAQKVRLGVETIASAQDASSLVEKLIHLNFSTNDMEAKSKSKITTQKVSDFLNQLVPLMSVALGIIGHILEGSTAAVPVTAITNGTCFLLELAVKEKERKDQFLIELDRISYQARRVHELQKHPDELILRLLREKCLNLLAAVVNFLRAGLKYFGRNIFKNIGKSLFMGAEVWQNSINSLHLAYEEFDQALLLQIAWTPIAHSRRTAMHFAEDDEFRKWLTPSHSENDAQFLANLAQRADETLQWVLELPELAEWRLGDASASAKTLWLTGLPGTGKSTISAYLCDMLMQQYPEDIVLNFFCKRGNHGLTTGFDIVRTICYQLVKEEQFYRKFLLQKPELPGNGNSEDLIFFFKTLIQKPVTLGPKERTIFVLLDGIDELEDSYAPPNSSSYNSKSQIEILLEQLVALPQIRVLVTSRQMPELNAILSKSGTVRHITGADNAADIGKYVRYRVARSPRLQSGFTDIGLDPVEFLGTKANGIFLWASVVLDGLERTLSTNSFKQALDEVPPTMNSIYDSISARAEQRGTLKLMLEVLQWTVILPNPFTVRQMTTAAQISLEDRILDMEDFLRTECGALLDLVPVLGSGISSEKNLEIHIGHETFQAWLDEKFGPHARWAAHGKAARTCLLFFLSTSCDTSFQLYALTRWRWHLRLSMGVNERAFAEPLTALDGGSPLPQADAIQIFGLLYKFLTSTAVEKWVEHYAKDELHDSRLFWEVHNACVEIAAWCRTNKEALNDENIDQLQLGPVETTELQAFRDNIENLQTITRIIWRRVCHCFLWNTSFRWWTLNCLSNTLNLLQIYGYDPRLQVENTEALSLIKREQILAEEGAQKGWKQAGKLRGNLSLHLANSMCIEQAEGISRDRYEAIKTAGGFDDMSGVCLANCSMLLYRMAARKKTDEGRQALLEEGQAAIQEAIDDDPEAGPRYYYHLGQIYESFDPPQRELALQAYRAAIDRDPDHVTDARWEVYYTEEKSLLAKLPPAYDEAVRLLEHAIKDDPANAGTGWFHHLADVHQKRGDLAAARDTYKRLIAFDSDWHTEWENVADTYIDKDVFEHKRTFDWRSWCNALTEAVDEDPSYAHVYWNRWKEKADVLAGYMHFEIAVDILSYGVEATAARTVRCAQKAHGEFLFRLGEILCKKGDWNEAIGPLEEAVPRVNKWRLDDSLKYLAFAHIALEQWDEARARLEKLLEDDENDTDHFAHAAIGETWLLEGKPTKAIREYKSAIRILENWPTEHAVKNGVADNQEKPLDGNIGIYYIDLAHVYDKLERGDRALDMLRKALPYVRAGLQERIDLRTKHNTMWRREGRWHMRLAWLLEQLEHRDPQPDGSRQAEIVKEYELAVWVFERTNYGEDDFVEIMESQEAKAALERVRGGGKLVDPTDAEGKDARKRARISGLRADWANGSYRDDVQRQRQRGHA